MVYEAPQKNSRPRHMAPNSCEERSFEIENIKNCASNPMFWVLIRNGSTRQF